MLSVVLYLVHLLCFQAFSSTGFAITYPQEGDTVPIWRGAAGSGIPMTWTYNSTDDIYIPLSIYFVQAGPRGEESADNIFNNVNITSKTFNINIMFKIAAYNLVRVIHGQDYYDSGHFYLSLSSRGGETESARSSATGTIALTTTTISGSSATSTLSESESSSSSSITSSEIALPSSSIHNNSSQLGTEEKVGVGVGVAVFIGLVAGLFFMYRRRKRTQTVLLHSQMERNIGPTGLSVAETQVQQRHELDGQDGRRQLPIRATVSELPG